MSKASPPIGFNDARSIFRRWPTRAGDGFSARSQGKRGPGSRRICTTEDITGAGTKASGGISNRMANRRSSLSECSGPMLSPGCAVIRWATSRWNINVRDWNASACSSHGSATRLRYCREDWRRCALAPCRFPKFCLQRIASTSSRRPSAASISELRTAPARKSFSTATTCSAPSAEAHVSASWPGQPQSSCHPAFRRWRQYAGRVQIEQEVLPK